MTSTVEATEPSKFPPLDEATRERLYDLISEAADMEIALRRLLELKNPGDCESAYPELILALDIRLSKAMKLLNGGEEDD